MKRKEFSTGGVSVMAEHYTSTAEVKAVAQTRPAPTYGDYVRNDFFGSSLDRECDDDFNGFKNKEDLMEQVIKGSPNIKLLNKVRSFTSSIDGETEPEVYKERRYGFYGNHFDVDRYCFGNKFYMYREKKIKHEEPKYLNIVIDVGINCTVRAKKLAKAGEYLAQLLVSLDQDDYNLRITAAHGHYNDRHVDILLTDVKTLDEPLNYKRIMFMMSPAYFRGVGFGWFARGATREMSMLGYPIYSHVDDEHLIDVASTMLDVDKDEVSVLRMGDLLHTIERAEYADNSDKYIKDWLAMKIRGKDNE